MAEPAVHDEHAEIKKRAMRRLMVAGTLVTAAVVTLTVLNHKPEERTVPASTSHTPVVATPEPAPPEAAPEITAEEVPAPEAPPMPDSEATSVPTPPPPQVLNKSSQAVPSETKSRTEAAGTAPSSKAASVDSATPAKSVAPQTVTISPPPAAKKTAEQATAESKATTAPSAAPIKATTPVAPKGYVVQLGLFSNHENAVQLQKRLADHGIKSYTETRLNVGPFQDKAEADQAMTRLRNMGINAVLVPAH
ncbi:MAG: SPOR domain-containing protein [Sulfurimicrobium sp.]|nr:SPOR domain-containing protein [Sulfurimicrobium sp.]